MRQCCPCVKARHYEAYRSSGGKSPEFLSIIKGESGWRMLHNEGALSLTAYSSPRFCQSNEGGGGAGHVVRMVQSRKACDILVGNLEGKRPLGRPSHR
jgi:hypothetical protein